MRDAHEWLTVDEVAERFRRSPHTIRRWLRAGRFGADAAKLPSGGWLVRSSAVGPARNMADEAVREFWGRVLPDMGASTTDRD